MALTHKQLILQFEEIIKTSADERPLHEFLKKYPGILTKTFNEGAYFPTVFSKFRLAGELIPDFVMIGHRSSWSWDVNLIKIEPSNISGSLFTKHASRSNLRTAEVQVKEWQEWVKKNEQSYFVPNALKKLKEQKAWDEKPEFYGLSNENYQDILVCYRIIIGQRSDFQGWGDKYQANYFKSSANRTEIVPWDRLLDTLKRWPSDLESLSNAY